MSIGAGPFRQAGCRYRHVARCRGCAASETATLTPALRIALVVVSTGLYLGLAVLGRGGVAAFFAQPALTALAIVLVLLAAPGCSRAAT
jgi:hypothetical protein